MAKNLWIVLVLAAAWLMPLSAGERVLYQKGRPAPHLLFDANFSPSPAAQSPEAIAREYLRSNWRRFKLEPQARNLTLHKTRHSLTGTHLYFQQRYQGYPVEGADLVVSVGNENRVQKVYNTTRPLETPTLKASSVLLSEDDALDVGWRYLTVRGGLLAEPATSMAWRIGEDGRPRLIHRVKLDVDAPSGSWSLAIDAVSGEVLEARDMRRYRTAKKAADLTPFEGQVSDRRAAMQALREKMERAAAQKQGKRRASGTAFLFDPDPATAMLDDALRDDSADETFEPAYVERPLRDIAFNSDTGEYALEGPYAEIRDFELPATPPSVTSDGVWAFRRGDNAFNDAMTYYHVDQNQRYLQSLGYVGERAILDTPVLLDADGAFGEDQSYYFTQGGAPSLTFGHGCVDDNEDADVIIHEYGHGIQDWIHGQWDLTDGDEGAMGEGFCDYWAGSYSFQSAEGRAFFPERVFQWDGFTSDFCAWGGRVMNQLHARYNQNIDYWDHEIYATDGMIFESDELWSTPLFQSLLELYRQGVPIDESDRVVIESHFGLGDGLKMPVVAESTINAARALYPDGPHAQVFQNAFARHEIVAPVNEYSYIAAHVPPQRTANDWQSEIYYVNPNAVVANVRLLVYEGDGSGAGFALRSQSSETVAAGQALKFEPDGENQRWVMIESDQPLAGTSFFRRNPSQEDGVEEAGIPLFSSTETAREIILPHVPANRAKFWSGAVLLNPSDGPINLEIELFGDSGADLSHLISPSAPTVLAPRQKWVTFLAEGPNGETGVFDDAESQEKVSWVRFVADGQVAGFQLYGYKAEEGEVATAGIMALPDQRRTHFPIRASLTDVEWAGFSILNPTASDAPIKASVIGRDGSVLAEVDAVVPARQKRLGLNQADGFSFPSNVQPLIQFPAGASIQTVLIESDAPLRIFELTGDLASTQIDGGAVIGLLSRTLFTDPDGKLEIFKVDHPGDVIVTARDEAGQTLSEQTYVMDAGETVQIEISGGQTASVEVRGERFTAAMFERDADGRSLTVVNGKQVEYNPNGQE